VTKTQLPRLGLSQWSADADTYPGRTGWNTELSTINQNAAKWGQGLMSARPVAAYSGFYYFATDTQRLWYDNGSVWTEISPVGGGGTPQQIDIADTGSEGSSRIGARADHQHALPVPAVDPGALTFGNTVSRGSSATVARADHTHAIPALPYASAAPGALVAGSAGVVGNSTDLARANHTHTLPESAKGTVKASTRVWQSLRTTSDGWPINAGWGSAAGVSIPAGQALPGIYVVNGSATITNVSGGNTTARASFFRDSVWGDKTVAKLLTPGEMWSGALMDMFVLTSEAVGGMSWILQFRGDGGGGNLSISGPEPWSYLQIVRVTDLFNP